ncbi:MAG: class I adenylate-forming enzyme family protein [Xanthobacteraceae bacterium]
MSVGLPLTIPNAFARNARWFAGGEAVVDSSTRVTYAELDDLSLRAAALFASLGAEPGKPLALLCVPSSIYLVAWLGAIRMGALPMALHTRESAPTLAAICRKIEPTLLVYDASMEALAGGIVANYPELRTWVEACSALPPKQSGALRPRASIPADLPATPPYARPALPAEDDPAVIVLSSGTTSVAKGVVHTHRGFIENARTNLYMYHGLLPRDRSLVPLSTAFIGCYNGWFPFLNAGACTIFMEHFDLDELPRKVSDERATHVFLTPTLWRRILNAEDASAHFRSVRLIGFAAEPMDATTLKRLRETISPNIVQVYGSTEIGAAATCINAEEMVGDRLVSIGRPLVNGDLRVVVPGGKPNEEVARGEIGEVLISSPSLAAGIWRDPEATANSFIIDGGRRWWRSRDLGRLDAGGYLYLEGRRDDMIISGGINIMPARVEDILLAHPGVAECAVVGVPHPEWGEEVQAFVVRRDQKLDAESMELYVGTSDLSPYQRPRVYHFVAELPRTSSNKVLRRILREEALRKLKSDTDLETIAVQTTGRK